MIPIIYLFFIFFGYISMREVSSKENCPNPKYPWEKLEGFVTFACSSFSEDPCIFNIKTGKWMYIIVDFTAPEDVTEIYYNVTIAIDGDKINAHASGKVDNDTMGIGTEKAKSFPKNSRAHSSFRADFEGDLSAGEEGIVTAKVYFNENTRDIPDMCVKDRIKIVDE